MRLRHWSSALTLVVCLSSLQIALSQPSSPVAPKLLQATEGNDRHAPGSISPAAPPRPPDLAARLAKARSALSVRTPGDCTVAVAPPPGSFPGGDVVWFDDALPPGSNPGNTWTWDTTQKASGASSFTCGYANGFHEHYFDTSTGNGLPLTASDAIVVYALLNECQPPQEILFQFRDETGDWSHRAYWGADLVGYSPKISMGALPPTGQWVRLEISAAALGLAGHTLTGFANTLFDGQVWADRVGKSPVAAPAALSSVGVSPASVIGGTSAAGTVMLTSGAPPGNATVSLSSDNAAASVPSSVTVTQGTASAGFTVTTSSVAGLQNVTITATYLGVTKTATLQVTPSTCTVPAAPPPGSFPGGDVVWFDDALPAGSSPGGTWIWDTSQKASGSSSFTSGYASGFHEQYFSTGAGNGLPILATDLVVVYALLNPCQPPQEILLQFSDETGNWNHRVYWGPDLIGYSPKTSMGALPATGAWVRLEIPAATLGLQGRTLTGFAVTLSDGQVWADRVGRYPTCTTPVASPPSSFPSNDVVWFDDSVPAGATTSANWLWDTTQKASGTKSHRHARVAGKGYHEVLTDGAHGLVVNTGDKLVTYALLDPCDPPREIFFIWRANGSDWNHRAYWGENLITEYGSATSMGALPAAGQWVRLEVPASAVGLEGKTVDAWDFFLYDGSAWFDRAGDGPSATPAALSSLGVAPSPVLGGASATGTVTLTLGAPVGGALVTLSSDNPAAAVPASRTVLQGQTSATFTITTVAAAVDKVANIGATYNGVVKTTPLTVSAALGTVTGIVVDNITSSPLGGVTVTPTCATPKTTDAAGAFTFDGSPGSCVVTLWKYGYASGSRTATVTAGSTTNLGTIPLIRVGTLSGRVVDATTLTAVTGATVTTGAGDIQTTPAAGTFSFQRDPGSYSITVTKTGYAASTTGPYAVTSGQTTATGDIAITAISSVYGIVTSSSTSTPLSGVAVSVRGFPTLTATTNAAGSFNIANVPRGSRTVELRRTGYVTDASVTFTLGSAAYNVGTRALDPGAGTKFSGNFAGATTWTLADSPYTVSGTIGSLGTLTIDAGVVVKFANAAQFIGTMNSNGTSASPVTLTSSAATPTAGIWKGLALTASQLSYTNIAYGGLAGSGGVYVSSGGVTLDHVTITGSAGHGVRALYSGTSVTITNSTIGPNAGDGIRLENAATAVISGASLSGNTGTGLTLLTNAGASLGSSTLTGNGGYAVSAGLTTPLTGLAGLTVTGNGAGAKNGVLLSGSPVTGTTRLLAGIDWYLAGSLQVNQGASLVVDPGAVVRFPSGASLTVSGSLVAAGTASKRIVFTSTAAAPARGSWKALSLTSTSSGNQLSYADVTYGGGTSGGSIALANPAMVLDNLLVANSGSDGLQVSSGAAASITVSNSTFRNNAAYGLNLLTSSVVTLRDSLFDSNGSYACGADPQGQFPGMTNVTATGNGSGLKNAIGIRAGTLATAGRWRTGLPLEVLGNIAISAAGSLTVDPGVLVRFAPSTGLNVTGTLTAVGTAAAPITFTSNKVSPTPGSWNGLTCNAGSSGSRLAFATISYGGAGNSAGIYLSGSSPVLDHVTLSSNSGYGLNAQKSGSTVSAPTLLELAFAGNTTGGLRNVDSGTTVDARFCHWNSANGPSGSGPGTGQSVSTAVLFEPWIVSAPSAPQMITSVSQTDRSINASIGMVSAVSFGSVLPGNWTVKFLNSGGTILKSFTGTGASGSATWDGRNAGAVLQPAGSYRYQIESVAAGNQTAAPASGLVILDTALVFNVQGAAVAPPFFSPNADGVQDTAAVTATLGFNGATWRVDVKNGGGTVVRTSSGSGKNISFSWDGRNGSSVLQPDGAYTILISAFDGTATATATVTATLDTTLPAAAVTAPASGALVSNFNGTPTDVLVTGSLSDLNLLNWALEVGAGAAPASWTSLATGTGAVSSGPLGTWATLPATGTPVTNWLYTLRLTVNDRAGNKKTVLVPQNVGNFAVTLSALDFNVAGTPAMFTTQIPANVTQTLLIKNPAGAVVRTLVNAARALGTYMDSWNGRNDAAVRQRDGLYLWVASITDGTKSMSIDLTAQMRTDYDVICDMGTPGTWDLYNNKPIVFHYTVPAPGDVGIIFGPPGLYLHCSAASCTPPWFCISFDEYQGSGAYEFQWAGVDDTGVIRSDIHDVFVISNRQSMSKNGFVMYGGKPVVRNVAATPPIVGPAAGTQSIAYDLTTYSGETATVTVTILNQESRSVLRTITTSGVSPGRPTITWDGRADNGMLVAPGLYTITVSAADATGSRGWGQVVTTVQY